MGSVQRKPHGLVLTPGSERLLRWLERYPFQRVHDLLVALSPWEKRTVVYERLAELKKSHLIEALHPSITRGKNLYHLSPLGMYVCDQLVEDQKEARRTRWERPGASSVVREERAKLIRLLPRLPVFVPIQELVNGLVSHASAALTHHGRRADVVQWSWQRDFGHAFLAPGEKRLHVRVEGALTLCLRYTDGAGSCSEEATDARLFEEHWYTLLLLHCPLDEIRLIRMRLDRLLRWRESAERTAVYSQMPALLILATTERQAEWWHLAALQVAARLRVEAPLGALACLPGDTEALANGWRLSWRRLGTRESCHLQELLHPLPQPAVPALLVGRGAARERSHGAGESHQAKGRWVSFPARLATRGYALSGQVEQQGTGQRRRSREYRLASLDLTPRHWEILRLIFAHPLLSREDLASLLALSPTTIHLLLTDLKRAAYLVGEDTRVGERWHLAADGLVLLARLAQCQVHRLVHLPLEDGAPLQQRGIPGLLHQMQHTAGVYGFFALLSAQLSTVPDARVRWWESGPISEWHFAFHEKIYRFRPDALACVQVGERQVRFWLEWDRGTMNTHDLQIKFTTYAMYLVSREWARSSPLLPTLLCVTPEMGQERRLAEAARRCLVQVPAAFRVYTTTALLLLTEGILAPIWQQVVLTQQQALSPDRRRVALLKNEEH